MSLAFLAAFAWRPNPPPTLRPLALVGIVAFYVALVLFAGEVLGE